MKYPDSVDIGGINSLHVLAAFKPLHVTVKFKNLTYSCSRRFVL